MTDRHNMPGSQLRSNVAIGARSNVDVVVLGSTLVRASTSVGSSRGSSRSSVYGNRTGATSGTGGDVITGVTFDAQDRMLTQTVNGTAVTYTYNNDGTLLRRSRSNGSEDFTYDLRGALRKVVFRDTTGSVLKTVEYVNDVFGRRVGKKVGIGVATPAAVEGYIYDATGRLTAKTNAFGVARQVFVFGAKPNVPEMMVDPLAGGVYRVVSDWRGSVRAIAAVGAGTNVVQSIDYDAWGKATESGTVGFQPLGFAGGLYDSDTKLVRFGVRDYDPETGRWTSKDPIRFGGGWNLYAYANDDPVNFVDPDGRLGFALGGQAGFAFGAVMGVALNLSGGVYFDYSNGKVSVGAYGQIGGTQNLGGNGGPVIGASYGVGPQATLITNFAEFGGGGAEVGINAGPGGVALGIDNGQVSSVALSYGPGGGIDAHAFETRTGLLELIGEDERVSQVSCR